MSANQKSVVITNRSKMIRDAWHFSYELALVATV
ncbi:DUF3265 domain-containing protein [Vibrio mediterranei]|nr:DUF3265 domain-containing protein [Vibrio mediterranei]